MADQSLHAFPVSRVPRALLRILGPMIVAGFGTIAFLGGSLALSTIPPQPKSETKPAAVQIDHDPSEGTLVICGGGSLPPTIRDRFCTLAGGHRARIVVIPTAWHLADDPNSAAEELDDWKTSGASSVQVLHTRSRETANAPSFVAPLKEATGVWLTGGDQVLLTQAYLGTAVETQLKALLARGGVIGGTSAGAAVMSGVMIAGGRTKADVGRGFDLISGAVVDQHFLRRNRVERLVGVLSAHPNLVGLGIDDRTALVFDVREHHLSVIGDSYVVACATDSNNHSVRYNFLKSGDRFHLADFTAVYDRVAQEAGDETEAGDLGVCAVSP